MRASSVTNEILDILKKEHTHLTEVEVYQAVKSKFTAVNHSTVYRALRRLVESELRGRFDGLEWRIPPEAEAQAAALPPAAAEVLYYAAREALRNAAEHGRGDLPQRSLNVQITATDGREFCLIIEDDGVGLENASTTSGSRSGLALHGTLLAVAGGALSVESQPGRFTKVVLSMRVM